MTEDLSELISRIDALKGEIDAMRPIDAELEQRIMQKFRFDWNYHSSNIEGNTLTYGETKTFLLHGLTAQGKPIKDHLEIKGHNDAVHLLEEIVRENTPLTEYLIKSLHQVILGREPYQIPASTPEGYSTQRWVTPGRYKQEPNHVRTATGEIFYFSTPEQTPGDMEELMQWYADERSRGELHPLIVAATFHYKFIRIHPFDDGNGRIARILMNLVLMMNGFPPAVIRTEDKENYYRALRMADGGDVESFIGYVGRQLLRSLETYLRGARGEDVEEEGDIDKKIAMFKAAIMAGDNIQAKRSPETVESVVMSGLLPVLMTVVGKLKEFDELFQEVELSLIAGSRKDYPTIDELARDIGSFDWNGIQKIDFAYRWKYYTRIESNEFSYDIWLRVSLHENRYIMSLLPMNSEHIELFRKRYDEFPTEQEQAAVARKVTEIALKELDAMVKANSGNDARI